MLEVLKDTTIDSLKLVPFLFITYVIMELLEKHAGEKTEEMIKKSGKFGPIIGALLGIVPQCGFSAVAANFYAAKIITRGTLIAIFLSTSDEMLPILISEGASIMVIVQILATKIIIGIGVGILIDLLSKSKIHEHSEIHKVCESEKCHCEEEGIIKSSINHTIQIFIYIFVITFILNMLIFLIGENTIANLIINVPILGTVIAALIGVIPNCASSIILTELYLQNIISVGSMIAGLLVNSGIGLLVLFRVNKDNRDNLKTLGILLSVGITMGIILNILM